MDCRFFKTIALVIIGSLVFLVSYHSFLLRNLILNSLKHSLVERRKAKLVGKMLHEDHETLCELLIKALRFKGVQENVIDELRRLLRDEQAVSKKGL
jgi:hypothetical protein